MSSDDKSGRSAPAPDDAAVEAVSRALEKSRNTGAKWPDHWARAAIAAYLSRAGLVPRAEKLRLIVDWTENGDGIVLDADSGPPHRVVGTHSLPDLSADLERAEHERDMIIPEYVRHWRRRGEEAEQRAERAEADLERAREALLAEVFAALRRAAPADVDETDAEGVIAYLRAALADVSDDQEEER